MLDEGFHQSTTDHSLFIRSIGSPFMALLVYVDNIIISSSDEKVVQNLKSRLDAKFKLKDLVSLRFFLGLEVARSAKGISIS